MASNHPSQMLLQFFSMVVYTLDSVFFLSFFLASSRFAVFHLNRLTSG